MPTATLTNNWPVTLPLPYIDYSGAPDNTTIQSATNQYASLLRRKRFSAYVVLLSVTWYFSPSQYQIFDEFYKTTIGNGAARFGIELSYPLNSELATWEVGLGSELSTTYEDGFYVVQAGLILYKNVVLTEAAGPEGSPFFVADEISGQEDHQFFVMSVTTGEDDLAFYVVEA